MKNQILASIQQNNIVASIPDDRDYMYVRRQGPFKQKYDLRPDVYAVEDQLQLNYCVNNAIAGDVEHLNPVGHVSRMFNSYVTRHILENTSGNVGMSLRDGLRAAKHFGIPLESLWPYDPALMDTMPPPEVFAEALKTVVTRYERIKVPSDYGSITSEVLAEFDLDIASALDEGLDVLIATKIGKDVLTLTGPWKTHKMRIVDDGSWHTGNTQIGNHAIILNGRDVTIPRPCPTLSGDGQNQIQGSWGSQFADGGFHGWPMVALGYDIFEAWVIRGFANVFVNPAPEIPYITRPEVVLDWYHKVYRNDVTDPMDADVQYWSRDPNFPRSFLGTWRDIVLAKVEELEGSLPQP